jgi:hypothetical protein
LHYFYPSPDACYALGRAFHDVENGVSIVGVNTGRMWASVLNTFLSSGMCSESSNRR